MSDTITHKGFIGSVHFSAEDNVFHGKIEGITDLVSFEGKSVRDLVKDFHAAVNDYIELCDQVGKKPEKSYKGSFNVRVPSGLHRKAAEKALVKGISLNQFVQEAIEKAASA